VLAEVRTGGRELRGTSGVADLDSHKPVNGNGFFRIGSNTKTFISVVLLQLVAEHRLSLDDTVGRWLPDVVHGNGNDGGKITVRELLQHTSGLHNYTDDLQAQITSPEAYRKLEFHQFSRQDLRSPTARTPPPAPRGTTRTPTTSSSG
jgi:D-alanyl-D-alanine carboxypeptidase